MGSFNWKRFETAIAKAAQDAVGRVMSKHAGSFYAVAFHEFYAETDGQIAMPCLAANTVEALEDDGDTRWDSPDWRWTQIPYMTAALQKLHHQLQQDAVSKDEEHWETVYGRFVQAFVRAARTMQPAIRAHRHAHKDTGVFVFSREDDAVDVLKKCMTPARFRKLFPHLVESLRRKRQEASRPLHTKLQAYREDLNGHQSEVLALGDKALPMLLDVLEHDEEQAWIAADLLPRVGTVDQHIMAALRRRAASTRDLRFREARALALLGDVDFVLSLADQAKLRPVAVCGICALYLDGTNECPHNIPLDYHPLEVLLQWPECRGSIAENLAPGSSLGEIAVSDVGEALRGLESRHAVIRYHAVQVLGDRRLGKQASIQILPALAARLTDPDPEVRHLAALALMYWKKAAVPYKRDIQRLLKDSKQEVRQTAQYVLGEIG